MKEESVASAQFPTTVLSSTGYWLTRFSSDFHSDIPQKIHNGEIANDGAPQWHPDFAKWLTAREVISTPYPETPTQEQRLRTTRALRRLRKEAVREYEVIYRIMVLGESLEDTTQWLNDRALRNAIRLPRGRAVHYRTKDTIAIVISGIDKMRDWW
jgi:hypothetical protein